jgi:parallel beta-helix repeat protein
MKHKLIGIIICMLLVGTVLSASGTIININRTSSSKLLGNTLYAGGDGPGNYTKIQDAIDDAVDGDTVFVYDDSSPYYEYLRVNKSINLIGEDKETTVIDGNEYINAVLVFADGVTVSGFTIRNGNIGIRIFSDYNTITDNTILSKEIGIYPQGYSGNTITGNTISNNEYGIVLIDSNGNTITGNTISNNAYYAIYLGSSSGNNITDNTISNNGYYGIFLEYSSNNIISDNSFFNDGFCVWESYQNTVSNNTVNGKPLVYFEDESDKFIDYEVGQVILVNCNKITVENLNLSNTYVGIELWETDNSMIRNNDFSNNLIGIYLYLSSGNTITANTISNSEYEGVYLRYSSGNTITGNTISDNEWGIYLSQSKSNTITGNIISNNENGIFLGGYTWLFNFKRIFSGGSNNNIILKNNFLGNERDAFFSNSFRNQWNQNYWDKPQILPKLIRGEILWITPVEYGEDSIPWFPQIDWRPALEPYEIDV